MSRRGRSSEAEDTIAKTKELGFSGECTPPSHIEQLGEPMPTQESSGEICTINRDRREE